MTAQERLKPVLSLLPCLFFAYLFSFLLLFSSAHLFSHVVLLSSRSKYASRLSIFLCSAHYLKLRLWIMSGTTTISSPPTGNARKGKSRQRGGRGGRANEIQHRKEITANAPEPVSEGSVQERTTTTAASPPEDTDECDAICWICAEPVKYYSVSECNHRTCHVCALRLRALYKRKDCTFCKASSIFCWKGFSFLSSQYSMIKLL